MEWKKLMISNILCILVLYGAEAQKIISEARVEYTIGVSATDPDDKEIFDAFRDATQVIWFKANMARTDFSSPYRNQSTIMNAATGETVVLREAGAEKFMWVMDSAQWRSANKRYLTARFSEADETLEISGFLCKKGFLNLGDSTLVTVFFTSQLQPLARGYDPMFEQLPGFPVMYEWKTGSALITYTLSAIQNLPVSASRFESPKSGYKIIKAPITGPLQ